MGVTAEYLNNSRFEVGGTRTSRVCDLLPENGGADSIMPPPEFLLALPPTCAAHYARGRFIHAAGSSARR